MARSENVDSDARVLVPHVVPHLEPCHGVSWGLTSEENL